MILKPVKNPWYKEFKYLIFACILILTLCVYNRTLEKNIIISSLENDITVIENKYKEENKKVIKYESLKDSLSLVISNLNDSLKLESLKQKNKYIYKPKKLVDTTTNIVNISDSL